MSSPRYDWWSYVKGMIRRYPELKMRYGACCSQATATNQREYEAVRMAIEETERRRNGSDRLKIIQMVLWERSHTVAGAALLIPCHEDTAKVWHGDFIRAVARNFGLMDE